jgi:hypothetical protein
VLSLGELRTRHAGLHAMATLVLDPTPGRV